MKLAEILVKASKNRLWVGLGGLVALAAAVASMTAFHSTVYASASTQMLVDGPRSALADSRTDLTGFTARAVVFARLMTSPEALNYIGQAAGIPGNLIAASGPTELDGPNATHAPTAVQGGHVVSPAATYKLNFLQNPELPTVDVYADAPTVKQAIALANGAVKGFGTYIAGLEAQTGVPGAQRVDVLQLGGATGGVVDPGGTKTIAVLIFFVVFALWGLLLLFVQNLRPQLRTARAQAAAEQQFAMYVGDPEYTTSEAAAPPPAPEPENENADADRDEPDPNGSSPGSRRRARATRHRNGQDEEKVSGGLHVSP